MRSSERVNPKESKDFHSFCTASRDSTQGALSCQLRASKSCSHVARSSPLAAGILRATKRIFHRDTGRISARTEAEAFKL